MRRLCCFTGAPDCPEESTTGSRQCNSLQCSLVNAPAGYNLLALQNKKYAPEGPSNRTAKPKQQTTNEGTNQPPTEKGERGEVQVAGVRVFLGRQSSASLVTSASSREAKPTRTKRKRRQRQKTQRSTTQTQEKAKPTRRRRSEQTKQDRRQRGGQNQTRKKGAWGKKASGGQQKRKERTPGKAAGAEKTAQTKKADAFSVSGVLRFLDHPRANTSVQVREVSEQHPQHGGEGKASHRAEAFVPMRRSEDRSQSASTRHIEGMTTGPLQIEPDTRREGPAEH